MKETILHRGAMQPKRKDMERRKHQEPLGPVKSATGGSTAGRSPRVDATPAPSLCKVVSSKSDEPEIQELTVLGFACTLNVGLGHLSVAHDGSITWDELQAVKSEVWGPEVRAIEVYPADADVVNALPMRHLWRLGVGEFCPDLLGNTSDARGPWEDTLEGRYFLAWDEAHRVGVFARDL